MLESNHVIAVSIQSSVFRFGMPDMLTAPPMSSLSLQEAYPLTDEQIADYRQNGFIKLEGVIPTDQLAACRDRVAEAVAAEERKDVLGREVSDEESERQSVYSKIFTQRVNLWQRHPAVKELCFSPRFANLAARLCGEPVRIWHDQALFKEARTGSKTPWHQDAPYWPHADRSKQITIWIALRDATIENGCMSFLAGTQVLGPREPVHLGDANPKGVYEVAPEARGIPATVVELPAGSCTFHHGLTFHYAGPNRSDATREAFAIIYMPATTRYTGETHVLTDGLQMEPGQVFTGEIFPLVSTLPT